MNSSEYRAAIAKLGMTQRGAAKFFKRNPITGQRWAQTGPTEDVEMWLLFMLAVQADMHIKDVPEWINLMIRAKPEKPHRINPITSTPSLAGLELSIPPRKFPP